MYKDVDNRIMQVFVGLILNMSIWKIVEAKKKEFGLGTLNKKKAVTVGKKYNYSRITSERWFEIGAY